MDKKTCTATRTYINVCVRPGFRSSMCVIYYHIEIEAGSHSIWFRFKSLDESSDVWHKHLCGRLDCETKRGSCEGLPLSSRPGNKMGIERGTGAWVETRRERHELVRWTDAWVETRAEAWSDRSIDWKIFESLASNVGWSMHWNMHWSMGWNMGWDMNWITDWGMKWNVD